MFHDILLYLSVLFATASTLLLISAIIYLSVLDGWHGFMFYTLPARSLNYMTGHCFNAKLHIDKLNTWNGNNLDDIFDNK